MGVRHNGSHVVAQDRTRSILKFNIDRSPDNEVDKFIVDTHHANIANVVLIECRVGRKLVQLLQGLQECIERRVVERSGTDLFNTIRDQLLTKYMAANDRSAGCLLVAIAKDDRQTCRL